MSNAHRFTYKATLAVAVTCGLFFGAAGASRAGGTCSSATIAEDFVLPGGAVHPAGELTLCATEEYSPVASLNEMRVDGMPIGESISRRERLESHDENASLMLFVRERDGKLRLVGYTQPAGRHAELYSFVNPRVTASIGGFLPRSLAGLLSSAEGDGQLVRVRAS